MATSATNRLPTLVWGTALLALPCVEGAPPPEDAEAFFRESVLPLLKRHCFECHSHEGGKAKGGLVLDSRPGWMTGGDSGPAIVPGKPEESRLIAAVRRSDPDLQMPPKTNLEPTEIAILEKWVADGAHDPRDGSGAGASDGTPSIRLAAQDLWSFQPLQEKPPPEVDDPAWSASPVDRFIRAALDQAKLPPAPLADQASLLRRLHLVLTGLPPTPEELAEFEKASLEDPAKSIEHQVDRLLASPAFGERWARHWLDLTAYADTIGVGRSIPAVEAWRFRDYVIDAFNDDKPFPEFIREQIAGDIQEPSAPGKPRGAPPTAESIIATGFLAIGPWELVGGDKEQLRMDVVDKQVHRVGQAFLGMTLGCARCHEHKFDPVSQEDYYALAGIFRSTVTLDGRLDGVFSAISHVPLPENFQQLLARAERVRRFEEDLAKLTNARNTANEEAAALKKRVEQLEKQQKEPATTQSDSSQAEELASLKNQRDAAQAEAKKAGERIAVLNYLRRHHTESLAMAVRDTPEPEDCRINIRGNAHQLGERVKRGFLSEVEPMEKPAFTRGGSGRVQLAQWIANQRNPLTARVWVNRVWHHLFGTGLVRTVDNFGARGELPSHPALLDHLAAGFMNENWSTKKLIRRLVLTRAWQQASVNPEAIGQGADEIDPENRLLWRAHRTRLEAEAIRDSMLAVSGLLDPKRGGSSLPLDVPGNLSPGSTGNIKDGARFPDDLKYRRSIYLPQKRKGPFDAIDFLGAFDLPDTNQETGRRAFTEVPAQALALVNSPFTQQCGKALAERFAAHPPEARVQHLYRAALGRPADPQEAARALAFLTGLEEALRKRTTEREPAEAATQAWSRFGQSLLISNEFLFRP